MAYFKDKIICPVCNKRCGYERLYKDCCSKKCRDILKGIDDFSGRIKKCPICDTEFLPNHAKRVYCSDECRDIMHKANARLYITKFSLFHRDNFKCIYCGKSSIEDGVKLHIEHINPLSKGGLTDIKNLVTSCEECNNSKSTFVLSSEAVKRILVVINDRNKNLSKEDYNSIIEQITELQSKDFLRIKRLKKVE